MNRLLRLLAVLCLATPLHALAVPSTLSFTARIQDGGRAVTGTHSFTFKLLDASDPATAATLWEEAKDLAIADGVVATALGDTAAFTDIGAVFNGLPVYLQVTLDGTAFPLVALHSVPYAIRASVADSAVTALNASNATSLSGWDQATFQTAGTINAGTNPVDWTKLKGVPAQLTDGVTLSCSTNTGGGVDVAAASYGYAEAACTSGVATSGGGGSGTPVNVWLSELRTSDNSTRYSVYNANASTVRIWAYVRCCTIQ